MTVAPSRRSDFDRDAAIVVASVGHVYKGGTVALKDVDLTIGTGLFGLLGPNGAGKSTLMRIVCSLLVPTQGRVEVCGYDVTRDRLAIRRLLGYLPQVFGAWRLHRVEEVLDTLALLSGLTSRLERRQRVREVLESVGLGEVADRKVKKLSGGMVRRLGVAQALVHEPRVLVVDEPTVGLDPQERLRFRQLMADLGQDRTIVLSTHIVADLGSGCHDLALLDAGELVFRGAPDGLLAQASGQIFEVEVEAQDEARLETRFEIVSRTPIQSEDGSKVKIRGVANREAEPPIPPTAKIVEAETLEEGYLAFMAARGPSPTTRSQAGSEREVAS